MRMRWPGLAQARPNNYSSVTIKLLYITMATTESSGVQVVSALLVASATSW